MYHFLTFQSNHDETEKKYELLTPKIGGKQFKIPPLSEKQPPQHLHNKFNRLKGQFNRLKPQFNRLISGFNRLKPSFNRLSHFGTKGQVHCPT
jgi:hypothetical protein